MSASNTLEILKSALLLEIRGKAFYENRVISHGTIVRNVYVGHDPIVITDTGDPTTLHRAPVQ